MPEVNTHGVVRADVGRTPVHSLQNFWSRSEPISGCGTTMKRPWLPYWRRLRRRVLEKPVLFVGTGTCGLGAGAGKTLAAVRAILGDAGIEADVVEVGCIGLCSEEPLLDVQLPGRTRLCFARRDCPSRCRDSDGRPGRVAPRQRGAAGAVPGRRRALARTSRWLDEHPFLARPAAGGAGHQRPDRPGEHRRVHRLGRLLGGGQGAQDHDAGGGLQPVEASGPARAWRRRLPHGQEVEVRARQPAATRSTSSATPTKATPARSWTARSARATRTACWKAWLSRPTPSARRRRTSTSGPSIRWRCSDLKTRHRPGARHTA